MNPTRTIVRRGVGWLSVLAVLVLAPVAWSGEDDPFAPENFVDFKREAARPAPTGLKAPSIAKQIELEVSVTPRPVRRGEIATLTVHGKPQPGWRTYPITERSGDTVQMGKERREIQDETGLVRMTFPDLPGLKPLWPLRESEPQWKVAAGEVTRAHTHPFTWSQDLLVLPDAEPGVKTVPFSLRLYLCDENNCLPPSTHTFEATLDVSGAPAVPLTPELQKRLGEKKPPVKVLPVPPELKQKAEELKREEEAAIAKRVADAMRENPADEDPAVRGGVTLGGGNGQEASLVGLLLTASLSALGMLLTPCVFPMIPVTVSYFLKQAERKNYNAKLTAGVYALTIIVVLSSAVLLLGTLMDAIATSTWFNLVFGVILVVFSLSLFGMYEIELPSFLTAFTSARERQGGYLGSVFMALTFTIASFTCTGPILGLLLAPAAQAKLGLGKLILTAVVYATTFAAPFFVLALFPKLLKALPKSGGWLNSVKVVMGFLEVALALKFLAIADDRLTDGQPWFFTYDTVLCFWIALSIACGLYLLGLYRLPHDSPIETIGVPRLVLASVFLGLAIYMTPLLWREIPAGALGGNLDAFLPADTRVARAEGQGGGGGEGEASGDEFLGQHLDYAQAWETARREGKLIFIDITGRYCQNCRLNENGTLALPEVRKELGKYVRVQMFTDVVPRRANLSAARRAALVPLNKQWQQKTFETTALPVYVVFKPDPKQMEENGKLKGTVLGMYSGKITDPLEFLAMVRQPKAAQMAEARR